MRAIWRLALLGALLCGGLAPARAEEPWSAVVARAKGQTVYWNAWGGDERTNGFIDWVGHGVQARYGITVQDVKLSDTAEAVTRVLAEKTAGRDKDGSVDLIWINGPNFLSMKQQGLLYGPFATRLPAFALVDTAGKPSTVVDFTVPVEGMESPWRLAQFVLNYDSARLTDVPHGMVDLLAWAKRHPGRFTHPAVHDFLGATFLKQALVELAPDSALLQQPATDANFAAATAPLWAWYDELRPLLWRQGKGFPASGPAGRQLLADGEIDLTVSFDPAEAAAAVEAGLLPQTVRTAAFKGGSLGNTSFVAIPYNSPHADAAMVVADFLLEPATQAHAQDIRVLGSYTVLDLAKLSAEQRRAFTELPSNPALPTNAELGPVQLEPHASWMTRITEEWGRRYTRLGSPGVVAQRPRRSLAGEGLLVLLLALFGLPIVAGLLCTFLPAFGLLPSVGPGVPSLAAWQVLFGAPGFLSSLRLTLVTGVSATLLSLVLAVSFCATLGDRLMRLRWAETLLAPLLAAPHAAMAIGLAFVLAPSGWAVRLASPWAAGWALPPDIATVGDPLGLTLVVGLVVKETPFLVLVLLAALNQVPARSQLRVAAGLGYGRVLAWIGIVLPQLYPQIRLPVYIVLAFSLSVVDMALVLGPSNPAPLAVVALHWFQAPDLARYPAAAACAALLLGLVVAGIAAWSGAQRLVAWAGRAWLFRGRRQSLLAPGVRLAGGLAFASLGLGGAALLAVALWSVAWRWPFPAALPTEWSLAAWRRQADAVASPLGNTLLLGLGTAAAALVLAIACLELRRDGPGLAAMMRIAALPLLMPQIAFQFGAQVLLVRLRLDGGLTAVAWMHLLFVFPYVLIALADPWAALDRRYGRAAAALGASRWLTLVRVKLPILLRPLLVAGAIGFAVSVAQYLPTLFAGGGRVATLTTEAVTLSSGGDRRVVGILALLQSALPLIVYVAALRLPGLAHAGRAGLR